MSKVSRRGNSFKKSWNFWDPKFWNKKPMKLFFAQTSLWFKKCFPYETFRFTIKIMGFSFFNFFSFSKIKPMKTFLYLIFLKQKSFPLTFFSESSFSLQVKERFSKWNFVLYNFIIKIKSWDFKVETSLFKRKNP